MEVAAIEFIGLRIISVATMAADLSMINKSIVEPAGVKGSAWTLQTHALS
jgi:hypothetical protein